MWKIVTSDPHLVRLGDWLVDKEEQSASEKWRLERMFMKTPWIWDLKVILVESPDYDNIMVPFVMILSKKRSPTPTVPLPSSLAKTQLMDSSR